MQGNKTGYKIVTRKQSSPQIHVDPSPTALSITITNELLKL